MAVIHGTKLPTKIFYFWLEWEGVKHALATFRATRDDAEAWVAGLKLSNTATINQYHLLECQDDSSRIIGFPDEDYFKRLVLNQNK